MLRFVSVSRSPMAMCRSNVPAMEQLSLQIYPSSNELQRRVDLAITLPLESPQRGYAHLFNASVLQADEGCDFDFMTRKGKTS